MCLETQWPKKNTQKEQEFATCVSAEFKAVVTLVPAVLEPQSEALRLAGELESTVCQAS